MVRFRLLPVLGILLTLPIVPVIGAPQLQSRWKTATGGELIGNGAVSGGEYLFVSDDKYLYRLQPESGEKLRRVKTVDKAESGPVLIRGGNVLVEHEDGFVGMYNRRGELVLRMSISAKLAGPPVVDRRGIIYCAVGNGDLYSFTHTGRRRWVFEAGEPILTGPVLTKAENRICVITESSLLWISAAGTVQKNGVPFSLRNVVGLYYLGQERLGILYPDKFRITDETGELLHTLNFSLTFRCSGGGITDGGDLFCFSKDGTIHFYHLRSFPDQPFFSVELLLNGTVAGLALHDNFLAVGSADWVVYGYTLPGSIGRGKSEPPGGRIPPVRAGGRGGDHIVLKHYAESNRREDLLRLIDEIKEGMAEEKIRGMDLYILDLLEPIVKDRESMGVGGKRGYDEFADIRGHCVRLLGTLGNLETQEFLAEELAKEDHPDVLRSIIYALAMLGIDPEKKALSTVKRINEVNNTLDQNTGLAADILVFADRIMLYNGYYVSGDLYSILYSIFRTNYPRNIRKRALDLIESG